METLSRRGCWTEEKVRRSCWVTMDMDSESETDQTKTSLAICAGSQFASLQREREDGELSANSVGSRSP
jgi:hypothetical protein